MTVQTKAKRPQTPAWGVHLLIFGFGLIVGVGGKEWVRASMAEPPAMEQGKARSFCALGVAAANRSGLPTLKYRYGDDDIPVRGGAVPELDCPVNTGRADGVLTITVACSDVLDRDCYSLKALSSQGDEAVFVAGRPKIVSRRD